MVCLFAPAGEAGAQSHLPHSTDVSVGFRSGQGGTYANREGATFDLVLGYSLQERAVGQLVGGMTLGVQSAIASDLSCLILPDGGCAPDFPTVLSGGLLLGVQRDLWQGMSARVFTGPAFFQPLDRVGTPGLLGSVDVTTPFWQELALVATLRQSLLSGFDREPLAITSFSVGVRFQ